MAENATSSPAPDSDIDPFHTCTRLRPSISVFCVLSLVYVLMLPVFVPVLYLGYKHRERRRSSSTDTTSHTDLLTYHAVALQLNEVLGFAAITAGIFARREVAVKVGMQVLSVVLTGKTLFHLLTCAEHYLAVVHPITYLGLKRSSSAGMKHARMGCVWLLSAAVIGLFYHVSYRVKLILYFIFVMSTLLGTSFCGVSVLWALRHPRPGKEGGKRVGAERSKRRAFCTVGAIIGVLLIRVGGNLVVTLMLEVAQFEHRCVLWLSRFWFEFPSSLVLPLLFLQRAGKLQHRKRTVAQG